MERLVSKLDTGLVYDVGPLAESEVGQAFDLFLKLFRIDTSKADTDGLRDWKVRISDGWPRHYHNAMRALADEIVESGGKLVDVNMGKVQGQQKEYRDKAYSERFTTEIEGAEDIVGGLMALIPQDGMKLGVGSFLYRPEPFSGG